MPIAVGDRSTGLLGEQFETVQVETIGVVVETEKQFPRFLFEMRFLDTRMAGLYARST